MESAVILANPRKAGYMVGGAENQLIQLGVELAKRNKEVTLIGTVEHDLDDDEPFAYERISGNWSRLSGWRNLYRTLKRIKPDVFVTRVLNPLLPVYGIICKLLGIKLMYFCAHDWEIESRPDKRIQGWRWRMFWVGIHFTNRLFVQNTFQLNGFQKLLLWNKSKVTIIRNIPLMDPIPNQKEEGHFFTWIGSYRPHKRPEWVIELAERLPNHQFEVVVDVKHRKEVGEKFAKAAADLPNFSFIPGVARQDLPEVYGRSRAILITSEGEGFPNVAIEAWSQGKAVISTFNNALKDLENHPAVYLADTVDEMVELIEDIDSTKWQGFGEEGLHLMKTEFSREFILNRFLSFC